MIRPAVMRAPFLLILLATLPIAAQDWKVGLAAAKITPTEPVPMAGYASRTEPFSGIDSDLFAKALALEDADGHRALILTADILGFPPELAEAIAQRLQASDGIAREDILLNGSHTHSAPLVAGSMQSLQPGGEGTPITAYRQRLEDQVVEIGREAWSALTPAKLSWGRGVAKFVMNRREFTPDGVILGVNPRGLADRTVPVLRIESPGGDLRAVVFGAASHCTTLTGGNRNISGDYAGYAQQFIEQSLPGVQAMFLTGCGGDANPYPRGTAELARNHGKELADEVVRVLETGLDPVAGPLATQFRRVALPLQSHTRAEVEVMAEGARSYRKFYTDGAIKLFEKGQAPRPTYTAPFALWRFGDDLTLVAFPGETLVDYAKFAEQRLGPLGLWVAGYSNDLFGYLPSARVLEEGGYETRGLYVDYGLFQPRVEDVVMDAIVEMAKAAGRKLP